MRSEAEDRHRREAQHCREKAEIWKDNRAARDEWIALAEKFDKLAEQEAERTRQPSLAERMRDALKQRLDNPVAESPANMDEHLVQPTPAPSTQPVTTTEHLIGPAPTSQATIPASEPFWSGLEASSLEAELAKIERHIAEIRARQSDEDDDR
jgi:hypothetical protein